MGDFAAARDRLFKSPLTAAEGAALAAEAAKIPTPTKEEHDMSSKLEQLQATETAAAKSLEAATAARKGVQGAAAARVAQITADFWEAASQTPEYRSPNQLINAAVARFTDACRSGDGAEILSSFVAARVLGFELATWVATVANAIGGEPPNVAIPAPFDLLLDAAMTTVCRDAGGTYRAAKLAELDKLLARP